MPSLLIILGNDTAAAERSAKRAGFEAQIIPARDLPRALRALADAAPDAPVLFTTEAIDQTALLEAAALERRLLTPTSENVVVMRDPKTLHALPKFRGLKPPKRSWLNRLLRKLIPRDEPSGEVIEAVFIADGWSVRLLGAIATETGQPADLSEVQRAALNHIAVILTQRHDTRGLFGLTATRHGEKSITPRRIDPAFTPAMDTLEALTKVRVIAEADRAVKVRK